MSQVLHLCRVVNFSLKCECMSSSGTPGDVFLSFISQFTANIAKVRQKVKQFKRPLKFSSFFFFLGKHFSLATPRGIKINIRAEKSVESLKEMRR